MINTGGFDILIQVSLDTIRDIVLTNLVCSNAEDLPCSFHSSFNFCNREVSAKAIMADSSIGCIPPDGRKMIISLMEGPLNGTGRVAIDMPVNISVTLPIGDKMKYEGNLNVKLPILIDGKKIVGRYSILREENITLSPSPDITSFIALMDPCILEMSSLRGGPIPASYFFLIGDKGVTIQWIREEDSPRVQSIDTTNQTMIIEFPTVLDYDFSGADTDCSNHLIVEMIVIVQMPYVLSEDSLCMLLDQMTIVDHIVSPESVDNFRMVLQCFGYAEIDKETEAFVISLLFMMLADVMPEQFCETLPDISKGLSKAVLEALKDRADIVIYNTGERVAVSGKVFNQGIWFGFGGSEYPPNNIANYLTTYDYFTFQVSKNMIQPKLDESAKNEKDRYNNSDDRFVDGNEIKLESFNIALLNNKFKVNGRVKLIIDCWPDANIDFEVDVEVVGLSADGKLLLTVGDPELDYDVSCIDLVLGIFTLGIYAIIRAVMVSAIKDTVGSADFLGDVGDNINESNTDLDLADGFDTKIRHSFQRVEVSKNGIGFWGLLFVISPCGTPLGERTLYVDRVRKDINDDIIAIRILEKRWKFGIFKAIDLIEKELLKLGNAYVVTRKKNGRKYLRNYPNDVIVDNLDELPSFDW